MQIDPVSDMLASIKNQVMAKGDRVVIPASKLKANICKVLKEEGYIKSFKILVQDNKVFLKILLKEDAISGIKRVSTPGLRVYKGYEDIPRVLSGLGISIVSTSKGVLSSRKAKSMKLGGEILCNIW